MAERAAGSGDDRKARLAAALRENLKRRKAQARGNLGEVSESDPADEEAFRSSNRPTTERR